MSLRLARALADWTFLFKDVFWGNLGTTGQGLASAIRERLCAVSTSFSTLVSVLKGYVPSDAIKWLNPDNNRNLLNRKVMMTANATLSIPCSVRQDPDIYYHKLGILKFPNKPNGKPMRHIVTSRQAVLFAESKNQQKAKNFLAYLIQPQIIGNYLKAAAGCTLPVLKSVWKDPFWTDPSDPHISTAAKTLIEGPTRPFYYVQNPAYSMVLDENVWGKAFNRIIVDGISPQQAADEAIARLQEIFDKWQ